MALTPSNMEGGTERRLLRQPDGPEAAVSVRVRALRRCFGTRRSLRPMTRSLFTPAAQPLCSASPSTTGIRVGV